MCVCVLYVCVCTNIVDECCWLCIRYIAEDLFPVCVCVCMCVCVCVCVHVCAPIVGECCWLYSGRFILRERK